ncbi:DUF58 domain-containing protein [Natronospirillum operosum]|uniref:DUF58 domain-containing protein n=1 Tax=Natronospirillum operosum TaxID=2759953 RepID=A0A4Z0WJR9_9GAMM|nr:DUF58 domain-containing protein [Natronospirillum operosum]TGG95395.1 DUF58 domain-containing protein [Natronospirillum operosum]
MGMLRDATEATLERWIRTRTPPRTRIRLGQRQIFIIPNRYGMGLLLLVLLLFVMGTNYQNNLVLALAFWLVALFVLSIHLTYLNLSGLQLQAGHSASGFVGAPMQHAVHLHSQRPRYGLLVSGDEQPERWLDELAAQEHVQLSVQTTPQQRGLQPAPRLRVETRFPFGWITAWTYWLPDQQGIAWPVPVDHGAQRTATEDPEAQQTTAWRNDPEALDDVREYSPGDPQRRILWRHYARRGVLAVKAPPPAGGETRHLDSRQVVDLDRESGLQQLCWWVLECDAAGTDWSLRLPDYWLPPGRGEHQRLQGLDALALSGSAPAHRSGKKKEAAT